MQLYKSYLENFRINAANPSLMGKILDWIVSMKLDLKDFQTEKCAELLDKLAAAREEYRRLHEPQALVFSSPTGSGKTITLAALIEQLICGAKGHPARPYSLACSGSPIHLNLTCRVATNFSQHATE